MFDSLKAVAAKGSKNYTDKEIIAGIKTEANLSKYIHYLYDTNFRSICNLIRTNSGSKQDAEDVFQEALWAFFTLVREEKFRQEASIKTLLYSISRNLWLQRLRKLKKTEQAQKMQQSGLDTAAPREEASLRELISQKELREYMMSMFAQLGDPCKQILTLFYFDKMSMKQILLHTHYKTEQALRNKKHSCWKQFKQILQEKQPRKQQHHEDERDDDFQIY